VVDEMTANNTAKKAPLHLLHRRETPEAPDSGSRPMSTRLSCPATTSIVVVDDDPAILELLRIHLEDAGYNEPILVDDPTRVLDLLQALQPDLLLTDVRMPQITGLDLLREVRSNPVLEHLPVVVLTSATDSATRLEALELGATDFLSKPVDPSELLLRIRNNLEVKAYQDQLTASRRESDRLLLSILPEVIAERLKRGESVADHIDEATVLFADLVNFTSFAAETDAAIVVEKLNMIFRIFDQIVITRGLEKIKTIGDAYMLAGGVPTPLENHAALVVDAGLAMLAACERLRRRGEVDFNLRIGVASGPVVAGVIGNTKFAYDLWGDTVNVASRMERHGVPGRMQITDGTRRLLDGRFLLDNRELVDVKGKGPMATWFVNGPKG
jgi:class 3 adenylate cyclase